MRSFIRHPSDFPIELSQPAKSGSRSERTKNLSAGGVCCNSRERLDAGTTVYVRIPVGTQFFESEGTVAWCKPSRPGYTVGIQFIQEDVSQSLRMVEEVCRIQRYRQDIRELEGRELTEEEAADEWLEHHRAADSMY